jgi:lipopolysaccharide transport system permease protein
MFDILKEIFIRRDLIKELIYKDLKLRYSRPALGFLWAFLSPLFVVLIFYLVFFIILRVKTPEAPFLLYLMSAVFPWKFFQDSLTGSVSSLVDNKNLVRESKFPHYFIPLSIVLSNAINFIPALAILIMSAWFILKSVPVFIMILPVILVIHLAMAMGAALILSIINVKWRDTKYILEAVLLVLFYLTPAFYSIDLVKGIFPPVLYSLYISNPFVGLLSLYRLALLKGFYGVIKPELGLLNLIVIPAAWAMALLAFGFYYYKKNRTIINDYIPY